MRENSAHIANNGVECNVEPAANGIVGRVFPCLEAVVMRQVMGWFPVIERLVAILNRSEPCGNESGSEEPVEGGNRLHRVCAWNSTAKRGTVSRALSSVELCKDSNDNTFS